jgi:hypothetical protein
MNLDVVTSTGTQRSKRTKRKANRGPRRTIEGLRPQHPQRGGKRRGNDRQHVKRTATKESTRKDKERKTPLKTHRGHNKLTQSQLWAQDGQAHGHAPRPANEFRSAGLCYMGMHRCKLTRGASAVSNFCTWARAGSLT